MGNLTVVVDEDSEITLSRVRCSTINRLTFFLAKKFRLINRFSIALFVPTYEIANYEGSPRMAFSKSPLLSIRLFKKYRRTIKKPQPFWA